MQLDVFVPVCSLLVAVIGLIASIYYAASTKKKSDKKEADQCSKDIGQLTYLINNLVSKEHLDKKLEHELCNLKSDFNLKIDDFKTDVKVQIEDLKHDIKSQKEFTSEIKVDVIRTLESDKHAHSRIDILEKRVDDFVTMLKHYSKGP